LVRGIPRGNGYNPIQLRLRIFNSLLSQSIEKVHGLHEKYELILENHDGDDAKKDIQLEQGIGKKHYAIQIGQAMQSAKTYVRPRLEMLSDPEALAALINLSIPSVAFMIISAHSTTSCLPEDRRVEMKTTMAPPK